MLLVWKVLIDLRQGDVSCSVKFDSSAMPQPFVHYRHWETTPDTPYAHTDGFLELW